MKRFCFSILMIAGSIIGGFFFMAVIEMATNTISANALVRGVASVQHPEQSRSLKGMAVVKNVGGSNDCTWMGGEFRSSSLSKKEIEDFYSPRIIESYKTPNKSFDLYFHGDEDPYGQIHEFMDELARPTTKRPDETVYLVLATDGLHHAGLDVRCF